MDLLLVGVLRNKNTTENDYNVVLKCLNNSEKMDPDCLNELKNFFNCKTSAYITSIIHRITQDPKTKKLNNEKLKLLSTINRRIHTYLNFIHRDLHSGNILIDKIGKPTIADLGLSRPMEASSDKNAIYGVIPYVAPEALKRGKFNEYSDIYSFGMIIWEVISGCRPFSDRKHEEYLIPDILDGLRPKFHLTFRKI
ncbi:kinase-like domain-containing protein [Gigaspora rosea]|uniref:Kinase-like domain-containing protein n=1 Tax=Gigaspora rosea TaxID=44941 RepID=A0A397VYB0_9GLOM|nr:kinase-like domain-containing protein [Gigaspora rosea]